MKATILSIVLGMSMFIITTNNVRAQQAQQPPHETVTIQTGQLSGANVQTSFVCFVNNKYMGKEQIPVEVNDKTYYGCCMGCVGQLKNNRAMRYATDPSTGKEVDKATAYIVVKPGGNGEVWYFESEQNYRNYMKNK